MKNNSWLNSICGPWYKYKAFVEATSSGTIIKESDKNVQYWREKIFLSFVLYAIPFSIIALLPQLYSGVKEGKSFTVIFDLVSGLSIFFIALHKNLAINFRKAFVATVMYLLTVVLILNLGILGPGIICLLAVSIFLTVIFPRKVAYWSVALHVVTCAFFAMVISLKLFGSPLIKEYNLITWITFSCNLIFLTLGGVLLISEIINALECRITEELGLKKSLELEAEKSVKLHLQLQDSEDHYKSLFSQNPSPMWVYDFETLQFLQVNEAAVKQYGFSEKEFLRMTIKDIRSEEAVDELINVLLKKINHNKSSHVVTKHCTKDNRVFEVDVRGNTITFKGKEARLIIARDISEQVKHVKAIQEQNKKFQEIAFIQSHLVRAPLARILGLVSLLLSDKENKPDVEILNFLEKSAEEFDEIIKTITNNTIQFDLNT